MAKIWVTEQWVYFQESWNFMLITRLENGKCALDCILMIFNHPSIHCHHLLLTNNTHFTISCRVQVFAKYRRWSREGLQAWNITKFWTMWVTNSLDSHENFTISSQVVHGPGARLYYIAVAVVINTLSAMRFELLIQQSIVLSHHCDQ